jgi:hypothetical protein
MQIEVDLFSNRKNSWLGSRTTFAIAEKGRGKTSIQRRNLPKHLANPLQSVLMNSLHTLRTAIKRSFLKWSFLSLWLTLGCTFSSVATDKPNILIILVDDAGYNDFGFMGCPDIPTPRIDRLASLGTILTDAHVTATVCSPSRAGLITGRYQQRFGHECNSPPDNMGMSPAEMTLGDVLGEAGQPDCLSPQ